jgi:hypothetical protein
MVSHRGGTVRRVVPLLFVSGAALTGCTDSPAERVPAPTVVNSARDAAGAVSRADAAKADAAKTVKICADVADSVKIAAAVGAKAADGSLTQAQAVVQMRPISTQFLSLSDKYQFLPIGPVLWQVGVSGDALERSNAKTPAEIQDAARVLASATKNLIYECRGPGE